MRKALSGTHFIKNASRKMATNVLVTVIQRLINNDSSDSESSSDEEWSLCLKTDNKRVLRPRVQDYAKVVSRYTDNEFKSHFRMTRTTFNHLLTLIHADLVRKVKGCETIPARQQLMIAVWKMATPDSYRSICDRFNVGKATALRAVRRVTKALFKLAPTVIRWPARDEVENVIQGFEASSGFPNIVGAIDGTHIAIEAPRENAADYINRKGQHSIHLQVVCDHRALITHCYAGHPGSVHDQRVFRRSEVANFLNSDEKFPAESHLIGDAAYEIHNRLLVPFKDNGHLTILQNNYNYILSAARTVVERCFALLKGRLRSLLDRLPMTRIDLMAEYIVACCVIHNICILRGDEFRVVAVAGEELPENIPIIQPHENQNHGRIEGVRKRNMVMNNLRRHD